MKIIKLDRRYRYYPEFDQAIYFPFLERRTGERVVAWLQEQYGPCEHWDYNTKIPKLVTNPNWRYIKKKRRIYLKNQADISMVLLLCTG